MVRRGIDWDWHRCCGCVVRRVSQVVWALVDSIALIYSFEAFYVLHRLADLREGRCIHGLFYNQPTCCSGFDGMYNALSYCSYCNLSPALLASEICTDWKTWGEYLSIRLILGQALLHSFVYVALAVNRPFSFITPSVADSHKGGVCRNCSDPCSVIRAIVSSRQVYEELLVSEMSTFHSAFHTGSQ